jgi:hypothetical protein
MPWKYVMPSDVESLRRREATVVQITNFWQQFVARLPEIEARLAGQSEWDVDTWMREQLATIHPRLRYEFGQDLAGLFLVITPEGAHHLRPMTETVIRRAPEIPNWSFRDYRPAKAPEEIPSAVRARTGHLMGTTTVQIRMGDHRQLDFVFQSMLAGQNEQAALENAWAAIDYLLGEEVVQRWVGHVDVVELSHELTHSFIPLPRVRSMVLDLIGSVMNVLPDRPYWKMPALAKIETKYRNPTHDDYARQDDAMFGATIIPDLREAGFKPGFSSSRFSRQGELFCHLKIDASDVELDERYKRKKMIEEAMDAALREEGVGAVVGTATGKKYVHFDLAVVDVVKTLEIARRRLLALEVLPPKSWILFYDADLEDEYIGLRSSSPKPPLWQPAREQPRLRFGDPKPMPGPLAGEEPDDVPNILPDDPIV